MIDKDPIQGSIDSPDRSMLRNSNLNGGLSDESAGLV